MDADDLALRNLTYARFVELGRAPTAAEVAVVADRDRADVVAGWQRLHAQHAPGRTSDASRSMKSCVSGCYSGTDC
jgi:hypothetical protein